MIDHNTFSTKHIQTIKTRFPKMDQLLVERTVFALELLNLLAQVGLPFIFKGGSALLLLLPIPHRLSTDIDIIVEPGINVKDYLKTISNFYPFSYIEEQNRIGKNNISKEHYKFHYNSPISKKEIYILLDVVYDNHGYETIIERKIVIESFGLSNALKTVRIPSVESILADKLIAFAPHTTGVPFEYTNPFGIKIEKTLEVIKQFVDVGILIDQAKNFEEIINSYNKIVEKEIHYRGVNINKYDVLIDSFNGALAILTRGGFFPEDYIFFIKGIKKIQNHIFSQKITGETAHKFASKIMLLVAQISTNTSQVIINQHPLMDIPKYKIINRLIKIDRKSFDISATAIDLMLPILIKNEQNRKNKELSAIK